MNLGCPSRPFLSGRSRSLAVGSRHAAKHGSGSGRLVAADDQPDRAVRAIHLREQLVGLLALVVTADAARGHTRRRTSRQTLIRRWRRRAPPRRQQPWPAMSCRCPVGRINNTPQECAPETAMVLRISSGNRRSRDIQRLLVVSHLGLPSAALLDLETLACPRKNQTPKRLRWRDPRQHIAQPVLSNTRA